MMISLTEPTAPRYLYINPVNNLVHLFVPVVGGQEISTDNTCKSDVALRDFFQDGAALRELNAYQLALEFDVLFLEDGHPLKESKQKRLTQINHYIKAIPSIRNEYSAAINRLKKDASNLYSMQLRPRVQDSYSDVVNPIFSLDRRNNAAGTPMSAWKCNIDSALVDFSVCYR